MTNVETLSDRQKAVLSLMKKHQQMGESVYLRNWNGSATNSRRHARTIRALAAKGYVSWSLEADGYGGSRGVWRLN